MLSIPINTPGTIIMKSLFLWPLLLCMSFGKCNFDMGKIDWYFAKEITLTSFPESLTGRYSAMYSSKFLSGITNCGQDQLVIQSKNLSLFCGEKTLAFCRANSITKQGRNYKVGCKLSPDFKESSSKPKEARFFTINYVSSNKVAIVNDLSHSFNRLYSKKSEIAKELN